MMAHINEAAAVQSFKSSFEPTTLLSIHKHSIINILHFARNESTTFQIFHVILFFYYFAGVPIIRLKSTSLTLRCRLYLP